MLEIKGTDLIPVEFDPFAGEPHLTLPLTRQQSEVWVESQMGHEASCAFNQCFVLHLRGQLSTSSLQNALDKVLARHAALRTIFDKEGSEQRILPGLSVKIGCDDLSGLERFRATRVDRADCAAGDDRAVQSRRRATHSG